MDEPILNAPSYEIYEFFPKDFFKKEVNEEFIKLVMEQVFPKGIWVKGNPNLFEPDYFLNKSPFEFTIASNKKKKGNFIIQLKTGEYKSENVENDTFSYIEHQIKTKAEKKYSTKNVHLCILCLLDRLQWVSDTYGSYTHFITDVSREQFFNKIKNEYIDTGKFRNIFIIFPDIAASWWVWDVLSNHKIRLQLLDSQIQSKKYPFFVIKNIYDEIFGETCNKS